MNEQQAKDFTFDKATFSKLKSNKGYGINN